ncbi:hypothetical protein [Psychrobacter glacincola]|uniref:hypothetical protein n=1 Tax=Psychrobacter glacincola TaxID=56810 RepID=UPI00191A8E89|nr:hypothetical protein [Psychrobacter glacincola]
MNIKATSGNNQFIVAIVSAYLLVSETAPEDLDSHAETIVKLILSAFQSELKSNQAFTLPYKDITDIVFYSDRNLYSDSIYNFSQNIENCIEHHYSISSDKHHNTKKTYVKRFMHINDKLIEHTFLAQAQRDYINLTVEKTNALATSIQELVAEAKITADGAKNTAEKAEETYRSMFANYVTILGVFTAIIATIFGGLNVVGLVMNNHSIGIHLLFVLISVIFLCLSALLYFLANLIVWITKSREVSLNSLFMTIVISCLVVIVLGLFKIS